MVKSICKTAICSLISISGQRDMVFSLAEQTLGDHRLSMLRANIEMNLFLKYARRSIEGNIENLAASGSTYGMGSS